MKKSKTYKRWPLKEKALQKRLFKLCGEIDHILKIDFPFNSLRDEGAKNLYEKRFWELFQETGYLWDKGPLIKWGIGHICCSTTITITFYVKGRNGEIIEC